MLRLPLTRPRILQHLRTLVIVSSFVMVVFTMGWIMGEGHYKKQISEALKSGDPTKAAWLCNDWMKSGADVCKDPLYFLTMAKALAERGNILGVKYNLDQLVKLLGDHK